MTIPDPRTINAPLRRTLDRLLLKWLGTYVLAASAVIGPVLCDIDNGGEDLVHAALPFFLLGFIAFHLGHRRPHVREDGWRKAFEADAGNARFAVGVAAAATLGVLAALVAIFCPHGDPMELGVALGVWLPIMAPLYAIAIWLAVDCSIRQLGESADAADLALRAYWQRVSQHGGEPARRS